MAIDIESLPPRIEAPPRKPSVLVGSLVFIACMVAGSAITLVIWPTHFPTGTPVFWVAVVIVPFVLSTLVTLMPWLSYAGAERSIRAWNGRRDQYVTDAFHRESQPVALLGSACRFPADDVNHQISKVAAGDIMLTPQQAPDRVTTVAARWFPTREYSVETDPREYDAERQQAALPDLLLAMLESLKHRINALPAGLPLNVSLFVDSPSFDESVRIPFQSIWDELALREFTFDDRPVIPDLMSLDTWLDRPAETAREHATLLVSVQLHDLVRHSAPPGSAEVATALLMVPQHIAERHRLAAHAHIHRPRQGTIASLPQALSLALKWGNVQPADIHHLWHAGFDKLGQQALLSALRAEKIALFESQQVSGEHDVDRLVGDAGIAADWFALACAIEFAHSYGGPQLVARHNRVNSMLAVVRPVLRSPVQTSL